MIVEMAGRPPEHLKNMLGEHVGRLDKMKDVRVHSIKGNEPRQIENQDLFTCFAEVDFEVENFSRLADLMFDFMPSSVEVIEPSKVELDCNGATGLLNNLSGRLHRYDELARMAQVRIRQLEVQLQAAGQVKVAEKVEKIESKGKKKAKGKAKGEKKKSKKPRK